MCKRWSHDNPHVTSVTNFQRRFTVNVWCGLFGNKLIGPFVFDNNLTWNAYEVFLRNELPDLLEDIPLMIWNQMYFQHDGTPPHYTRHVRDYLNESIPNRWLGRGGHVAWAPRSPDLTPLDYYLWGHMKTLVYETRSIQEQHCAIVFLKRQNTYATIQTTLVPLLNPSWWVPKTALQLVEDTLNNYCNAGTYFSTVV